MKGARYHVPDRGAIEGVPDVRARIEDVDTVCPDAVHEVTDEADLPLYLDIRRDLHMRLAMGEYTTGAAIPSEAKLAEQYGTTKVTVRNALDGLEEEGLIVRVQGKGTFATHGLEGSVTHNPRGFRDSHRHYQRTPSVRVLEATVREAGEFYARFFGVAPDSDLFYVRRLNCIDGVPFTTSGRSYPASSFRASKTSTCRYSACTPCTSCAGIPWPGRSRSSRRRSSRRAMRVCCAWMPTIRHLA